jgi:amino acid adenylation domain-containing protein
MNYESVQEIFSRTAAQFATKVAIDRVGARITYSELEAQSNRLANFLLDSGLPRGAMVALLTDDPIRIITGILAVLKAGAVFVPLDPTFPDQRLAVMDEQVRPSWYTVEAKYLDKLRRVRSKATSRAKVICLDVQPYSTSLATGGEFGSQELEVLEGYQGCDRAAWPGIESDPEAACSVYFTSGSTGKPKAIVGRLKGIDHFIRWEIETLGVVPGTRVSQLVSPSFDGFLKDAFVPLCAGGVVCAPETREVVLSAGRLRDWLDIEQVEVLHCIPSIFRSLINEGLESKYFEAMKYVVTAGEALLPTDVKRWMDVFGDRIKLVNLYGPTETTILKLFHFVRPEEITRPSIPIGQPIRGAAVLVVDQQCQPCGVGDVGEIYIRTPYCALGYYDEPELTREVFVQNPFSDDPADIVYKTGDYGRLLEDGSLEFLGRRDQQVKIRGVRVELGEIENLLRGHHAVDDVVVIDRDGSDGNKFLVAYVVLRNGAGSDQLRAYLAERLPEAMLPSAFVETAQLPRTLNGKIDRNSLPRLELAQARAEVGESVPRTPVEEIVSAIWCEVLNLPSVGLNESFFNLGGHSLLVTQVVSRIRESLKVELALRSLFEARTVERLSQLIQEQINIGRQSEQTAIMAVPRRGGLPLSFAQQRLWFIEQLEPGNAEYNCPGAMRLEGSLDLKALESTINEIVRRHEVLRTRFVVELDEPVQVVDKWEPQRLEVADLTRLTQAKREKKAEMIMREEAETGFDLTRGPLLRVKVLKVGKEVHIVLFTMHHIVCDGWSMGILIREVKVLYQAYSKGESSPLEELPIQYADFAVWQRERMKGELRERQLSYWKNQLDGAPPLLELPTDRPRPDIQTFRGAVYSFVLPVPLSESLKTLSQHERVTLFMTLLAALNTLLHRYTGQDTIVIGSAIANRNRAELERLIGFFVNTLVLRTDLSGNPSFRGLLGRVRELTLEAYNHQDLPFEKLVEELQPERHLNYSPLCQVTFTIQNFPMEDLKVEGLNLIRLHPEQGMVDTDFNLMISDTKHGLTGHVNYSTELFDAATIDRMMHHFHTLLECIVNRLELRLSDLLFLTGAEQQQLLHEWNNTKNYYGSDQCICELLEAQVDRTPDAIALVFQDQHLTYQKLNQRANQLAHCLLKLGVEPESLIGLYTERSLESLVGLLGILKAGGAYTPLDPSYPKDRIALMLEDAKVKILLTQERLAATLPKHEAQTIYLDTGWGTIAQTGEGNPASRVTAGNLAYAIYTSGSTGKPNGVLITQQALVGYALAIMKQFGLKESDRILQFASLSFDVSVEEIFPTLLSGATVVLLNEGAPPSYTDLLRLIEVQQLTAFELPTAYWHEWVYELSRPNTQLPTSLRFVIVGGEKISRTSLAAWKSFNIPLINVYGLTEATVTSTTYELSSGSAEDKWGVVLPIGQPIGNTNIYLLDRYLQLAPVGVPGEVYIGGDGLARCYLNRRELTAERLVPNPFSDEPGSQLYKTGDMACYTPDGNIIFLGRIDDQVKVRGYRVELGEIETWLKQHSGVQEAVVVAGTEQNRWPSLLKRQADGSIELQDKRVLIEQMLSLGAENADRLYAEVERLSEAEVETILASELQISGQREQTKIRRYPEFDLAVRLKDNQFINPPRESQRNWLLRRALDEFADDLRHLDTVSRRFVPGSARPRLSNEWSQSQANYDDTQLMIQGQQVMQDWEHPLMKAMAKVVTESHGDVLELGFGMGISATYIQEFGARSHTIVEYNERVRERFKKWRSQYPGNDIRLIPGKWHEVVDQLGTYDGIFFDTVPTDEVEYLREVIDNIVMAEDFFPIAANCLRKGGIFTWYTNEFDTMSRRHQRLILEYFSSFTVSVAEPLFPPEDCHYWFADSMVVVKAIK